MKLIDLLHSVVNPLHEADHEAPYEASFEQIEAEVDSIRAKLFENKYFGKAIDYSQWTQVIDVKFSYLRKADDSSNEYYHFISTKQIPAIMQAGTRLLIRQFGDDMSNISMLLTSTANSVSRGRFYKNQPFFKLEDGRLSLYNVHIDDLSFDSVGNPTLEKCYKLVAVFDSPYEAEFYNLNGTLDPNILQRRFRYPVPANAITDIIVGVRQIELPYRAQTEQIALSAKQSVRP